MEENIMGEHLATNIFNTLRNRFNNRYKTSSRPEVPDAIWQRPLYFFAFGFGSGAMPFAPGTFGTLMAIPFYLLFRPLPVFAYLIFVIAFVLVSSWASEKISKEINVHDHSGMCIDEFAGFFVTMINAPHGFYWILLGFILFRIFDILKPWPIYVVDEKMAGGLGMVLDDVIAGIYSCIIIQIIALIMK
jgi:phosphatidylglycerophosphatase A